MSTKGQRYIKWTQEKAEACVLERHPGTVFLEPFRRIDAPWRMICPQCGKECSPTLNRLRGDQGMCLPCGKKKAGETQRLSHEDACAEIWKVAPHLDPKEPYPSGAHIPWEFKCLVHGNSFRGTYANLQRKRTRGCRECFREGQSASKFISDEQARADVLGRGHDVEFLAPYPGTTKPWPMRCRRCGEEARPRRSDVLSGQGLGCKCKRLAFDSRPVGYVYRLSFDDRGHRAVVWGKTTNADERISVYRRLSDVQDIEVFVVGTGADATRIEKQLIELSKEYEVLSCRDNGNSARGLSESYYPSLVPEAFVQAVDAVFEEARRLDEAYRLA